MDALFRAHAASVDAQLDRELAEYLANTPVLGETAEEIIAQSRDCDGFGCPDAGSCNRRTCSQLVPF